MPIINYQGTVRTIEIKEQLIEKITELASEITGIPKQSFTMIIGEYPKESIGVGGISLSKRDSASSK